MFSEKIRMLRKERKLSQAAVGEQVGMSMRGYQDLELGAKPTFDNLLHIADFYGVSVDWLMDRTDNPAVPLKGTQSMTEFHAGQFDIAVIGAGHAGIEAALAAARLGMETIVFTINLDAVGNMPCNPAIGGTGKGHLVRELDALGGEMAKAADACCIQYRLLNKGKGPAVWSLRAQADRRRYQEYMKHTLERQDHLSVRQGEVVKIRTENGAVSAVVLSTGAVFSVRAVILATGTYLSGRTIVGECVEDSGPDGMHAAARLTDSLKSLGLPLRRFKTGTPPRVLRRSVDFSQMELQEGDALPVPFSYETADPPENQAVCYLTWTTEETKRIVLENLDRAPMYSGVIEGVGPRYCPSFETKVVRFPDKLRHQLFVEPIHPGLLLLHAGGGAAADAPQRAGPGARGDDPACLRH